MMNIVKILTGFDGRINRAKFWFGLVVLVVLALAIQLVLQNIVSLGLAQLLGMIIMIYFAASLYTKRLQDRGKPMMPWLAIIFAPGVLLTVMQLSQIGFQTISIEGAQASVPTGILGYLVIGLVFVVSVWAIVELGVLKGTQGPNAFGPDPLSEE